MSIDSGFIFHVKSSAGKPQNLHQNVDMNPLHDILNNLLGSRVGVLLYQRAVVQTLPPVNVRRAYSIKNIRYEICYQQVALRDAVNRNTMLLISLLAALCK